MKLPVYGMKWPLAENDEFRMTNAVTDAVDGSIAGLEATRCGLGQSALQKNKLGTRLPGCRLDQGPRLAEAGRTENHCGE